MSATAEQIRVLREALLGLGSQFPELYANSAPFYNSLNQLSAMLPAWIEGLAAVAEEISQTMTEQYRDMIAKASGPVVLPPGFRP